MMRGEEERNCSQKRKSQSLYNEHNKKRKRK